MKNDTSPPTPLPMKPEFFYNMGMAHPANGPRDAANQASGYAGNSGGLPPSSVVQYTAEAAIEAAKLMIVARGPNSPSRAPVYVLGVVAVVEPPAPILPPVKITRFDQ